MPATPDSPRILRIGIIGCGEIAQVAHISTLGYLSNYYSITYLCDVSEQALEHCRRKIPGDHVKVTRDPVELCSSTVVDVVFVINSDEYHVPHGILALKHDKYVFVEKPLALNERDVYAIMEAESNSKGKVMVGYMRRYAAAFLDGVKEIGGIEKILYARVRDIIGPNSAFVGQSGTFPKQFTDFRAEDVEDKTQRARELVEQGVSIECGVAVTPDSTRMWRLLGNLASHDLSAMREALGMPESVLGASLGHPFWNVLFQYPGFVVSYESGLDDIPRFDAHIEVYGLKKMVRIQIDTPYVKGLPTTLHIRENVDGTFKETMIRRTYEDAYTLEFKELYEWVVNGRPIKTTLRDALNDVKISQMVIKAGKF